VLTPVESRDLQVLMNRTVLLPARCWQCGDPRETVTVTASRLLDVDSGRILRDQVLIENERRQRGTPTRSDRDL
jgi:hypothetical protein